MYRKSILAALALAAILIATSSFAVDESFTKLSEGKKIADFACEAVYLNDADNIMGARFRHTKSGFVLDVLSIQSLPQSFMWVNSPAPSDQGEPHTMEHLLLGKGNKGRYVASLENMSLGNSSAFTMQYRTCYHYNTSAGNDVFFNLFEEKLDALLHPNFSDEEIRREVCNIGVATDDRDGSLHLEEKGTVYNEMVTSYERPWGNLYFRLGRMLYGEDHPLALESGGFPADIRTMTPEDIRNFHSSTHHLNNMGAIVSVANDVGLDNCLKELSSILKEVEPDAKPGQDPAAIVERMPDPSGAEYGMIDVVSFPHQNANEPGLLVYAWPPTRKLNSIEYIVFDLLVQNLASGQTSNLYRKFIDSQERVMNVEASSVFGWSSDDPGFPIYIGFSDIKNDLLTEAMIDSIRTLILEEIEKIASFTDGSEELTAFNERAHNRVTQDTRATAEFLNTPPRFGYRGTYSRWLGLLQQMHDKGGFERSLVSKDDYAAVRKLLSSGSNFWREYIADWRLLEDIPYGVGTKPDPEALARSEAERNERLEQYGAELEKKYNVADRAEAIARYAAEYDQKTAEIDKAAQSITMPDFIDNPPMTIDDRLDYRIEKLSSGGDIVVSTFDNISSATAGLVFNLYAIPEDKLFYVPILPTMMTEIGIVEEGESVPYDVVEERLRREVLSIYPYFTTNFRTQRAELAILASGGNPDETDNAMKWMERFIFDANLNLDNLPRIRDAVDLELRNARTRMSGSEESWVNTPANAYWRQNNPLLLLSSCFLTQEHAFFRIRWMLKDYEEDNELEQFNYFIKSIINVSSKLDEESFATLLKELGESNRVAAIDDSGNVTTRTSDIDLTAAKNLIADAISDLSASISETASNSIKKDVAYLCQVMQTGLETPPVVVLDNVRRIMRTLLHTDNVRGYIVANSDDQQQVLPELQRITDRFTRTATELQQYDTTPRILARLKSRTEVDGDPTFVGLLNESTRAGVHINSAPLASFEDNDRDKLLDFLAGRLYGGGGAHSMFMKTWGAGLAYSNGLRSNEMTGRMTYYAERCPDLSQTMSFVVDQLKNAPHDKSLADYAVSQAFAVIRSGDSYISRGMAMANDIADGLMPADVENFRKQILELSKEDNLYEDLHERMKTTYGRVLPGFGVSCLAPENDAICFVIGPTKQFESYDRYLAATEGDAAQLYRLRPRDYWLTAN